MNEITISNNNEAFAAQLTDSIRKLREYENTIEAMKQISLEKSETLMLLEAEQFNLSKEQFGYILGLLKANLDSLPDEIARTQKINDVPIDILIKLKVDQEVLEQRRKKNVSDMTVATKYWDKYRRLSELICGYGYNCSFIPERFEQFYPGTMHHFVRGFANGYSSALHTIAEEEGIMMRRTDPVTQDIWKNWPFFLEPGCKEYSLEGKYLFMYHGGWNCSGDPNTPYGNNLQIVNEGVYAKLKSRDVKGFTSKEFDMTL